MSKIPSLSTAIRSIDANRIAIRTANRSPLKRHFWHSALLALIIAIICNSFYSTQATFSFSLISILSFFIAILTPNTNDLIIDYQRQLAYTLRGKQLYVTPLVAKKALGEAPISGAKGWLTFQYGFSARTGKLMQIASLLAYQPAPNGFGEQLFNAITHFIDKGDLPETIHHHYSPLPSYRAKLYRLSLINHTNEEQIAQQLAEYQSAWQELSVKEQQQYYARLSQ